MTSGLILAATVAASTASVHLDCYNAGRMGLPPADFTLTLDEKAGTAVISDDTGPTVTRAAFGPESVRFAKGYFHYEVSRVDLTWDMRGSGGFYKAKSNGFCKLAEPPKERVF